MYNARQIMDESWHFMPIMLADGWNTSLEEKIRKKNEEQRSITWLPQSSFLAMSSMCMQSTKVYFANNHCNSTCFWNLNKFGTQIVRNIYVFNLWISFSKLFWFVLIDQGAKEIPLPQFVSKYVDPGNTMNYINK